jgi:hypothetical protein
MGAVDVRAVRRELQVQVEGAASVPLVRAFPTTVGEASKVGVASIDVVKLLESEVSDRAELLDGLAASNNGVVLRSLDCIKVGNRGQNSITETEAQALEVGLEATDTTIRVDTSFTNVCEKTINAIGSTQSEVHVVHDAVVPGNNASEGLLDDT